MPTTKPYHYSIIMFEHNSKMHITCQLIWLLNNISFGSAINQLLSFLKYNELCVEYPLGYLAISGGGSTV